MDLKDEQRPPTTNATEKPEKKSDKMQRKELIPK